MTRRGSISISRLWASIVAGGPLGAAGAQPGVNPRKTGDQVGPVGSGHGKLEQDGRPPPPPDRDAGARRGARACPARSRGGVHAHVDAGRTARPPGAAANQASASATGSRRRCAWPADDVRAAPSARGRPRRQRAPAPHPQAAAQLEPGLDAALPGRVERHQHARVQRRSPFSAPTSEACCYADRRRPERRRRATASPPLLT